MSIFFYKWLCCCTLLAIDTRCWLPPTSGPRYSHIDTRRYWSLPLACQHPIENTGSGHWPSRLLEPSSRTLVGEQRALVLFSRWVVGSSTLQRVSACDRRAPALSSGCQHLSGELWRSAWPGLGLSAIWAEVGTEYRSIPYPEAHRYGEGKYHLYMYLGIWVRRL